MSETGEPRRRRRQIIDGTAGDGGEQRTPGERDIPHTHTEEEFAAIPAKAQEGAAARRRRAQHQEGAQADAEREPVYERISRVPAHERADGDRMDGAKHAAKRGAQKAADGAKKAAKTAKRAAIGIGGMLLLLWEEDAKPALAKLAGKLRGTVGAADDDAKAEAREGGAGKTGLPREEWIRRIAVVCLACMACYCLFMIGSILLRTIRTNKLTDDLSRMKREAAIHTPEPGEERNFTVFIPETPTPVPPEETPVPRTTAQPTPTPTPRPLDTVKTAIYHEVGGDALPEMEKLYNENRDLIAWIGIEEVLDLPVVYRDNSYYLYRDFYKKKNTAGTLFLDVNHPFKERTQNLLLHGHNMKDGTMFGRLAQYEQDISYLKNHAFIDFDTLWKREKYVIFAVLHVSLDVKSDDFFNYYSYPTFSSDAAFESYVTQLQLRSMYAIPVDVNPGDALLTLSTCLDEDRLVIVARKLREGETKHDLRSAVRLATRQ